MNSRDQLASYLQAIEKRLRLGAILRGLAALVAVALAATVGLVLITNAFAFSDTSLLVARIALVLALAAALGYGLALPLRALNQRRAAGKAETAFPQFGQRLVTFAERDKNTADPFLELLAGDTMQVARVATPSNLVTQGTLIAWIAGGGASLVVLLWMILAGPGFLGYGASRLWAGSLHSPTPFYEIHVIPGDAAVRRNANQLVTAEVLGRLVDNARLFARYQSASKWEPVNMQRQPSSTGFEFLFAGLPESVEYYIEAGPLRSRTYKLRVVDLPAVKQIKVTYHFPQWTGMKDAVEEHGGDLRAVEGTEAGLNVTFTQPVGHAFLALDDGKQIDLSSSDRNSHQGNLKIEKDGMYHIATLDQGQPVRLSDDFFIEARKVNPPEVRITRPGGEYHASPIEEVTIAVHGDDDYGLSAMTLHYAVNGGPEQTTPLLKQSGAKSADGSTVISLENFKLVPGDLVSFYASAKDAHTESHTDMMFIQTEPFSREFSQSQVMGGGGGGGQGNNQEQISQREKEIIAETWKHDMDKGGSRQNATEAAKFLSGVQSKLRDQSLSLAGRLERRELTEENSDFSQFQQDMNAAAQAMAPAADALQGQKWKQAIPDEQKALQYLLRAEATFRKIEIAFGARGGGGGGGASGRDLASLFDLELDTEKNQYETEQTGNSANQRAEDIDKALQKLDELARRQEELAQKQPQKAQDFQTKWEQEMLRREAEKLQQQMAQMGGNAQQSGNGAGSKAEGSRGGGQSGEQSMQQALDQLRQADDDMRRATSQQQSSADARRAADRLREASDLLNRLRKQDAAGKLDSLSQEAQRLNGEQQSQAGRMKQAFDPAEVAKRAGGGQAQSEAAVQQMQQLVRDRQALARDLANLQKQMREATGELAGGQQGAAGKLRDALGEMQQADLQNRLQRSADLLRRGMNPDDTNPGEADISKGMERMNDEIQQARKSVENGQQNPQEALDRMASLREQVESLSRGLGERSGERSQQNGKPGERSGQPGEPGQRNGQANEPNGQTGERGGETGQAPGHGGTPGANIGGNTGTNIGNNPTGPHNGVPNGGHWDGERWYGGYDPGSYQRAAGSEKQQTPLTQADIERAYEQARRDLEALRQTVKGQPGPLDDISDLLRQLDHLDPQRFPGNPAMLDQLHSQVAATMDKLELQIRRQMDEKQTGQVRTGDALRVPDGYQDSVAEYFRRVSKGQDANK